MLETPAMTGFTHTLRNLWARMTGPSGPKVPPVVVHDPAAQQAHDLDDPFFDDKVQTRIGDVISHAGQQQK
jgi:hypothetical protein